jgi:MFS superfamily sulfate permease-like transporter
MVLFIAYINFPKVVLKYCIERTDGSHGDPLICSLKASEIPGIRIIQVAGGLHFANKDHVRRKVNRLIEDMSAKGTVVS